MEEERDVLGQGIDFTGVGQAMQAIPPSAWGRLVDTVCDRFNDLVAPITATTSGIGRLITAKFDQLLEPEKVLATATFDEAHRRAEASGRALHAPQPRLLLDFLDQAGAQADPTARELWANLLARDMVETVHPEIARLLSRIGPEDARLLVELASRNRQDNVRMVAKLVVRSLVVSLPYLSMTIDHEAPTSFAHDHLSRLGLIESRAGEWHLTITGIGFLEAVSGPYSSIDE